MAGTPVSGATLPASAQGPTARIAGGDPRAGQPYWDAGTVQTEPGVVLSLKQLVDLAIRAGFPKDTNAHPNAAEAAAVAEYESTGAPGWYNPEYSVQPRHSTNGSYGLTQIYRAAHADMATKYNLLDPLGNMLAAREMTQQNEAAGRRPWTGWTSVYGNSGVGIASGGYLRYYTAARGYAASSTATPGDYFSDVATEPHGSGGASGVTGSGTDWGQIVSDALGAWPVVGGALRGAGTLDRIKAAIDGLTGAASGVFGWVTNPIRVIKLVVGVGLIFAAIVILFLPEAAAVTVAAAGAPEAAPAVRSGVAGATRGKTGPGKVATQAAGTGSSALISRIQKSQKPQPQPKPAKLTPQPKPPTPKPAAAAPKTDEGEPVFMDGKRVGTERNGVITMDRSD